MKRPHLPAGFRVTDNGMTLIGGEVVQVRIALVNPFDMDVPVSAMVGHGGTYGAIISITQHLIGGTLLDPVESNIIAQLTEHGFMPGTLNATGNRIDEPGGLIDDDTTLREELNDVWNNKGMQSLLAAIGRYEQWLRQLKAQSGR